MKFPISEHLEAVNLVLESFRSLFGQERRKSETSLAVINWSERADSATLKQWKIAIMSAIFGPETATVALSYFTYVKPLSSLLHIETMHGLLEVFPNVNGLRTYDKGNRGLPPVPLYRYTCQDVPVTQRFFAASVTNHCGYLEMNNNIRLKSHRFGDVCKILHLILKPRDFTITVPALSLILRNIPGPSFT